MSNAVLIRAVVPMKPAYQGKSRLAEVLDAEGRAALSLHLLQHVLQSLSGASTSVEMVVIGGDEWVRDVAVETGAQWQQEPGGGLNGAIRYAVDAAFAAAAAAVLVAPGDLGLLAPKDVDDLIALSSGLRRVVLARAASDGGTNAILAPRGMMVGPYFGRGSFLRHLEAARDSGAPVEVSQSPGFAFDLDTPQDMAAYRSACPDMDTTLAAWRQRLLFKARAATG